MVLWKKNNMVTQKIKYNNSLSSLFGKSNWIVKGSEKGMDFVCASVSQSMAFQDYMYGIMKYNDSFFMPFLTALNTFCDLEKQKISNVTISESISAYVELLKFNQQVADKGMKTTLEAMGRHHFQLFNDACFACFNTLIGNKEESIKAFFARHAKLLDFVVHKYPEAIKNIKPEFGFHFDDGRYLKVAETERMNLYQVLPLDKSVKVSQKNKPIVIIPPYVLGANILCFLPDENKSYVHAFANQGIPTYIRILKDINTTPAVQIMTPEDDVLDTKLFCKVVKEKHGRKVTLNGFCQGGFIAVINILSGELDEFADALITCVTPMDGTRSISLVEYLAHLPARFRDLGYAVKTLPNGNRVVDGKVMSWVYKLKSMDREAPVFTFYRDLKIFDRVVSMKNSVADVKEIRDISVSKTAAAINYWLFYEQTDLPEAITKLSFDSYTIPVTKDGTLPVTLFGKKLNFKRLNEKGVKVLMCYAQGDDLVDKDAVLAPLDFIDAEVTAFPKGHGSIATSWSFPTSKCALHTTFGDNYRGPVRFQLDLS